MTKNIDELVLVPTQTLSSGEARFKVIEMLGKGGNSSVYMVQCINGPHQGLLFAAKLFTRVDKEDRLNRFRVELEFLKQPRHPAVMRVHYDGVYAWSSGTEILKLPFYIAEYLPKTLRDAMRTGLLMVDKVSMALQLISAIAFLAKSEPEIVHRDIKPENIFIKGRSAVLGDFGLLKAIGEDEVLGDFTIGSLSDGIRHPRFYPTPELIEYAKGRTTDLSAKSDVFQLGLVFAEMFCGVSPLRERAVNDGIELNELAAIPGDQGEVIRTNIQRMLTKDIVARPAAVELFDPWDGVFQRVVADAKKLEGRAFW